MKRVSIRIINNSGTEVLAGKFELPIVLGRGKAATVQFDQDRTITSREHAEIRTTEFGLSVKHLGEETVTIVNGKKLETPGSEFPLGREDGDIVIGDHMVFVVPDTQELPVSHYSGSTFAIVSNANGSGDGRTETISLEAPGVQVCGDLVANKVSIKELQSDPGKTKPSPGRVQAEAPLIAEVTFGPAGGRIEVAVGVNLAAVSLNSNQLTEPRVDLEHFDVVEIGPLKIEIAGSEPVILRCINNSCARINSYRPGENCKYCGYRLVESQSVYIPPSSRMD